MKFKIKLKVLKTIYFRTQDLQEELNFLEKYKGKIEEIITNNKKTFICSNSISFKTFVKTLNNPNVIFFTIPLEEQIGGNHLNHQELDDEVLHQRNIYTLLDMYALGQVNEIDFFTTWGRYSNFLFFSGVNRKTINFYNG